MYVDVGLCVCVCVDVGLCVCVCVAEWYFQCVIVLSQFVGIVFCADLMMMMMMWGFMSSDVGLTHVPT